MNNDVLIVTRHVGAVEYLRQAGVTGEVVAHATVENVSGRHVYGNIPFWLAVHAASVTAIEMPYLRSNQRGRNLSPDEMREAGARLATYVVMRGDE